MLVEFFMLSLAIITIVVCFYGVNHTNPKVFEVWQEKHRKFVEKFYHLYDECLCDSTESNMKKDTREILLEYESNANNMLKEYNSIFVLITFHENSMEIEQMKDELEHILQTINLYKWKNEIK